MHNGAMHNGAMHNGAMHKTAALHQRGSEDAGHLASCLLPNASRIARATLNNVHPTSALEHALTVAKEAMFAHLFAKTSIPDRSDPMNPTQAPITTSTQLTGMLERTARRTAS